VQEFVCSYFDLLCEMMRPTQSDFMGLISVKEALPHVYCVDVESRVVLASCFVRIQEYYECPDASIRRSRFTLDEFKRWYREHSRKDAASPVGFNFYLAWPGFNVPSWVLDDVRAGLLGPLRPQEEALLALVPQEDGPHYVIGVCEGSTETLQHELAHGLYATCPSYCQRVQASVTSLPQGCRDALRLRLLSSGYADDEGILTDEMQAYMVAGGTLASEIEQSASARAAQEEVLAAFREHAAGSY